MTKNIVITEGYNINKVGKVIEEGTFNVFGREITGVRVNVGQAGSLVIPVGEFEYVSLTNQEQSTRFKKAGN